VENVAKEPLTIMNDTIPLLTHGPSKHPVLTARRGLGVAPIGDKIYVMGRGPNPGLSVPWENEIYNVNRMD
jgi:hypothetical protein